MYFGEISINDAEGAILAHSLKVSGKALKKGRVLSAADIEGLAAAGIAHITAARLDPGDIHEDEAAARLAEALCGPGLWVSAAFTGRANLVAETRGILQLTRARIDALNRVDEAVTLASLAPFSLVEPRQMAATIKIIPFAVPEAILERCLSLARAAPPLLQVKALRPRRVGLLQSHLPGTKTSILDKTKTVIDARLAALDCRPADERRVPHEEAAVADATAELMAAGCEIVLLSGASAIVDRRDVLPAALARCGASIEHFGMPVDPGNLLLIARCQEVALVGLPGCARSPKVNGFDWVLQRLMADIPLGGDDIMAMGAGGLLKEIAARPLPRAAAVEGAPGGPKARALPRIGALLLAAGQSRRMGKTNKLLAEIDGEAMLVKVSRMLRASRADPILAVSGHDYERVEALLAAEGLRYVHNPAYASGISSSLKRGLGALPAGLDGVIVCLGDMPKVTSAVIDSLIAAFDPLEGRAICVPTWQGKPGNPVLFASRFIPELQTLSGDVGARGLMSDYPELLCEVPVDSSGVLIDADTPESLERLRADLE
jgi:molybdenum cofactor cytidylyltransferase